MPLFLKRKSEATDSYWQGRIFAALVYARELSAAELTQVRVLLGQGSFPLFYGIRSLIPPYSSPYSNKTE